MKFLPDDKEVEIAEWFTLLEAVEKAEIYINIPCGGKGGINQCLKVYILLDLIDKDGDRSARILQGKFGVAAVDVLKRPPDLLTVAEALGRQKTAEYLMDILNPVDSMTENLSALPVQESAEKKAMERVGSGTEC